MGLDLTLIPFEYGKKDEMLNNYLGFVGYTRLRLTRQYKLYDFIMENFEVNYLPNNVKYIHYEDEGIKEKKTDSYGKKLTYCLAKEFNKINMSIFEDNIYHNWNRSVIKMMQSLDPETPVLLWWH